MNSLESVAVAPIQGSGKKTKHPGVKKLPDGRWLVHKTWIDPRTGKRKHRRQIVEGTLDDAVAARVELRKQGPSDKSRSRPRFGEFAKSWLRRHKQRIRPSTYERYTFDVAQLTVKFRDWWVDAIDYGALEEWQAEVAEHYEPPTINGWHRTLRLVLDSAQRRGLLDSNPARQLTALPEGRTRGARGTSLSAEELNAFIEAIPVQVEAGKITEEMGRLLRVLAWTGMRIGELVALRWSEVVDGELRIERSVWRGQEGPSKTDDPRRVTVVAPVREVLDEQRQVLLAEQHPGLESGIVFPSSPKQARAGASRRGGGVRWYRSQSPIQRAVREVAKAGECPQITPHSLRRTFEDLLREAGVEDLVRRAVAGWRSERAQGIYATVKREDRDAAAAAVIDLVGKAKDSG